MKSTKGEARTLSELATLVDGEVIGDPHVVIRGVAAIEDAVAGHITFADPKKTGEALTSLASAVVITREAAGQASGAKKPCIIVDNPRLAFARLLELFAPIYELEWERHPSAVVSPNAHIGRNVRIHAHVVVEAGAEIGDGVLLYPGVYVGHDSKIGAGSVIYPNAVIRERVSIGCNCIVHPGAVIGSDGFGFVTMGGKHHKVPQIGTVVIEDDVEIGSNTTIDRATCGETRIKRGTKMDNLVQIGHNVVVGEDCLLVAQVGIAGSTELAGRVTMAGKSGAAGHLKIGENSAVAAQAIVAGNLPPNSYVSGIPARPHPEEMRAHAATLKLPETIRRLREMEKRLKILEELVNKLSADAR